MDIRSSHRDHPGEHLARIRFVSVVASATGLQIKNLYRMEYSTWGEVRDISRSSTALRPQVRLPQFSLSGFHGVRREIKVHAFAGDRGVQEFANEIDARRWGSEADRVVKLVREY